MTDEWTAVRDALTRENHRRLDELDALDQTVLEDLAERTRRRGGASLVYSVRLDPREIAALHRRAAYLRIKPTALARNYIRIGLSRPPEADGSDLTW